ncbi:MAG TPA: class I SAM-dependent methyltransferase [Polyangiaceae bacterium]|nr:class I SAM-dependent methyltransferase [Polyangiaceae bacterium]
MAFPNNTSAPTFATVAAKDRPDVDFGHAAGDYARHRPGFPPEFFDHVGTLGIGIAGQRILDLGTGTGTLACGFAERGCDVVGLDPSPEMLAQAAKTADDARLSVRWVNAWAEGTGLPDADFDIICAGQCWHWFDRARAATEAIRLLRAGGRLLIGYFSYLPLRGTVGEKTEEIVLRYNPTWKWAGHNGRHPEFVEELRRADFRQPTTFEFELPITFTHQSWRGRIRACNGVLSLPGGKIAAFDADVASLLAECFPEPLVVQHRIWGIVADKLGR